MAWNTERRRQAANSTVSVVVKQNGTTNSKEFPGNILVKDAVVELSERYSLPQFILEDHEQNEIEESEGDRPLADFEGPLVMMQRAEGA